MLGFLDIKSQQRDHAAWDSDGYENDNGQASVRSFYVSLKILNESKRTAKIWRSSLVISTVRHSDKILSGDAP